MRLFTLMLGFAGLSACASLPATNTETERPSERTDMLSPRTLAAGDCGLFVWTSDADKRFVLFTQTQRNRAVWLSPQGETPLTVKARTGEIKQGEPPTQLFQTPDEKSLSLDLRSPDPITNGTRYQTGTLTGQDENGWTRVTPVVGLSVCQPAG